MAENSKIKIGVIGAGHLGKFHIEQYMSAYKTVNLVGFFDINKKIVEKISSELNVKSYNNLDNLLDNCDGVSICTPTSTHADVAKKAILKNCHILIEKPITKNKL